MSATKRQAATGGVAMAASVVLAWAVGEAGVTVPAEIVAAVATLIGWAAQRWGQ